ncbi:MAG: hypothetical protein RIC14_04610 [Filomicrobium sp.]
MVRLATAIVCASIFTIGLPSEQVHANDMAECVAGIKRLRAHIAEFRASREYCRNYKPPRHLSDYEKDEKILEACSNPACIKIAPGSGARACLEAKKNSTGKKRERADKIYKRLFKIYKLCDVQ